MSPTERCPFIWNVGSTVQPVLHGKHSQLGTHCSLCIIIEVCLSLIDFTILLL